MLKKSQLLFLLALIMLFTVACSEEREAITGKYDGIELDVLTQKGEIDGKALMCSEKYQLCGLKGENNWYISSSDFQGTPEADSASCDPVTYKTACADHLLSYTYCDPEDNTVNTVACVRGDYSKDKSKEPPDFVLNAMGECRSFDYKPEDSNMNAKSIVKCIIYDSHVNGILDWELQDTPCNKVGDKTSSNEETETGKHKHKYVCVQTDQGDSIWFEI